MPSGVVSYDVAMSRVALISGKELVRLREGKFLSRAELAQITRVSISTLQSIEQADIKPVRLGTLRQIADGLKMEPSELVKKIGTSDGATPRGIAAADHDNHTTELLKQLKRKLKLSEP